MTVAVFLLGQRAQHAVPYATASRALGVSPAWFDRWRCGDASPRITAELREAGWRVAEKTVATIMREQRLVARARCRRRSTTRPGRGRWRAPDLVGRDSRPPR